MLQAASSLMLEGRNGDPLSRHCGWQGQAGPGVRGCKHTRVRVCARASVSEHVHVCPEGVAGGAGADGRRKGP